jgi:hypothetical protein
MDSIDASQVATLSKRQILALLLAIVCDIARRLSEPVVNLSHPLGMRKPADLWTKHTCELP